MKTLWSIFAVVGYNQFTETEYTKALHNKPFLATFEDICTIGDMLTANMDGVEGINYESAFCSKCEHCKFDKWVPHHPLFKCKVGGNMNPRTQRTIDCPEPIDGEQWLEENEKEYPQKPPWFWISYPAN